MEKQHEGMFVELVSGLIAREGHCRVRAEGLGVLLCGVPVVGGGADCIVVMLDERCVRLVFHGDGLWYAQELVPRVEGAWR